MPSELTGVQIFSWFVKGAPYIVGALLIAYLGIGGILDYHWRRYGVGIVKITQLRALYVGVGIVLFGVLFIAMISL